MYNIHILVSGTDWIVFFLKVNLVSFTHWRLYFFPFLNANKLIYNVWKEPLMKRTAPFKAIDGKRFSCGDVQRVCINWPIDFEALHKNASQIGSDWSTAALSLSRGLPGYRTLFPNEHRSSDNPSDLTQRSSISWSFALGFRVALLECGRLLSKQARPKILRASLEFH